MKYMLRLNTCRIPSPIHMKHLHSMVLKMWLHALACCHVDYGYGVCTMNEGWHYYDSSSINCPLFIHYSWDENYHYTFFLLLIIISIIIGISPIITNVTIIKHYYLLGSTSARQRALGNTSPVGPASWRKVSRKAQAHFSSHLPSSNQTRLTGKINENPLIINEGFNGKIIYDWWRLSNPLYGQKEIVVSKLATISPFGSLRPHFPHYVIARFSGYTRHFDANLDLRSSVSRGSPNRYSIYSWFQLRNVPPNNSWPHLRASPWLLLHTRTPFFKLGKCSMVD